METTNHISALAKVLEVLEGVPQNQRFRVLDTARAYFSSHYAEASIRLKTAVAVPQSEPLQVPFSEKRDITLLEFMQQKKPGTGIAKVLCIAFYLKHYLGRPKFDSSEITAANLQLAEFSVSEVSRRLRDAENQKYILRHSDGRRQLTSRGEIFVLSLPLADRIDSSAISKTSQPSARSATSLSIQPPLAEIVEASASQRKKRL